MIEGKKKKHFHAYNGKKIRWKIFYSNFEHLVMVVIWVQQNMLVIFLKVLFDLGFRVGLIFTKYNQYI
jgi:hypothetical protein